MRRARIAAVLGGLLALIVTAGFDQTRESARSIDELDPEPSGIIYRDEQQGVSVTLPPGWHRARHNLTPHLVDPREVLTVATYRLRYSAKPRCPVPGCPLPALDRFGREDVLISIQERRQLWRSWRASFTPRPRRFVQEPMRLHYSRCARQVLGEATWTAFRDKGRAFYAFVAIGRAAKPATRHAVQRVLDSLDFDRSGLRSG
jgi:hypothetical protein